MNGFILYMLAVTLFSQGNITAGALAPGQEPVSEKLHPLFISVTEFNHNAKENLLEISCKIFADDCEKTLSQQTKTIVDVSHPKDVKLLEKLLNDYIQKHLQLKVNGKTASMQYVGYEKESESVWCYLQVPDVKSLKKLDVTNSLLYDMYNTQIGIMHASVGTIRKSLRINYPETQAVFEF